MKLDEKLVSLRKKKGITQAELAETVQVSRQAVSKWESGSSLPSTENLRGLSELYGVPVDYLLNESEEVHEVVHVPKEEREDIPKLVRGNKRKTLIMWIAIVLDILLLAALMGVIFANKSTERHISISEMQGEDITGVPRREFELEW